VAASRVPDCVNAAVDGLKADATLIAAGLLGSAKVYTHVPQGTDAPYVLIIGGDEVPWAETFTMESFVSPATTDGGDSGGRMVDVVAQIVSVYRGSKQVDDVASRVLEVLTDVDTWAGVTDFQLAQFIRNQAQPPIDLNNDGLMYFVRLVTVRVTLG
jgi:hypothetical protein